MKRIVNALLLLVMAVNFSACVSERAPRAHWVRGHYNIGPHGGRYWVPGHYR